jgi:membrane associated rhomboid family serine protease
VSIAIPRLQGTVTFWVMAACVGVYVALALLNLLGVWSRQSSYSWLGLSWAALSRGMLWQLFTAPLLHLNVQHLVFNMLVLAFLGIGVERQLGRWQYVTFSIFCALAGSAGFLLLDHGRTIGAGYSGVIYGVMAACAIFWPHRTIRMFYVFPMKMKWAMLVMVLMSLFLAAEPGADAVAHAAHLAGAAAAFVYIKIWQRHRVRRQSIPVVVRERHRRGVKPQGRDRAPVIRVPDEL